MKSLLLIPIVALSVLFTSCETRVIDRRPRRVAYVEHDVYVDHPRRRHDDVVVVEPRPFYGPAAVEIRYYSDKRGRYYFKDGHRVYVKYY